MLNPHVLPSKHLSATSLMLCLIACLMCLSCGSSGEAKLALSNTFIIKGKLETAELNSTTPEFNFIDSQGLRQRSQKFKWSPESGEFEAKFFTYDLKPYEPRIWLDLLKMTKTPKTENLSMRRRAELAFEIIVRGASDPLGVSSIKFLQKRIALFTLDEISGNQLIDLGSLRLRNAYSVRTKIKKKQKAQDNNPEEFGIFVPFSKEVSESPQTPWDLLGLTPMQLFPNAAEDPNLSSDPALNVNAETETRVIVEPIPEQTPEFYFYYQQNAQCKQVLGKYSMTEYLKDPQIELIPCPSQETQPVAENDSMSVSYNESDRLVLPASSVKNSFGKEPYIFTNSPMAGIKIVAKKFATLGAIRVEVFNSDVTDLEPVAVNEFTVFTSIIAVDLPSVYTSVSGFQSDSGPFAIKITPVSKNTSEALLLRGYKSLVKPGITGENILQVVSSDTEFNLVNGVAGSLYLKSRFCDEALDLQRSQRKIGISILSIPLESSIVFANCPAESGGTLSYSIDDLLTRSNNSKSVNILTDARFFLVNEFGSRSENDLVNDKNTIKVYFDFGKPDLGASGLELGQQFGITASANSSSKQETAFCNFIYLNCNFSNDPQNKGPTRLKFDSSGLLTNAIFRFAEKNSCQLSQTAVDGNIEPYSKLSSELRSFALAPIGQPFSSSTPITECGADYDLKSLGLQAPVASTETLSFQILVTDRSGVRSEPTLLSVQPCESPTAKNETVCWEK